MIAVRTGAELPLRGLGVVVTRDEDGTGVLGEALASRGARVLVWRTVRSVGVGDPGPLEEAVLRLHDFDWLVLTSPRAVDALAGRIAALPAGLRVAAVGPATAMAARSRGWAVDVVPEVHKADALVPAMAAAGVGAGSRVLFPASEIARDTLETGLAGLGAAVLRVTAYRTIPAVPDADACMRAVAAGEVQVITFASPSAVQGLEAALGRERFRDVAAKAVVAVIGPTTAAAARAAGASRVLVADDHSLAGLTDVIEAWAKKERRPE
jgi:uroporphyrinogen III methyltransferase / synthase